MSIFFWKKDKPTIDGSKKTKPKPSTSETKANLDLISTIEAEAVQTYYDTTTGLSFDKLKKSDVWKTLTELTPKQRAEFVLHYVNNIPVVRKNKNINWSKHFAIELFQNIIRRKADLAPQHIVEILRALKTSRIKFSNWPIGLVISQLDKSLKAYPLTDTVKSDLVKITKWKEMDQQSYWGSDLKKARLKLMEIIGMEDADFTSYPLKGSVIGDIIQVDVMAMQADQNALWNQLFHIAGSASGSKPTKTFKTSINNVIDAISPEKFRKQTREWLEAASKTDSFHSTKSINKTWHNEGKLRAEMQTLLKGLVWAMGRFHDETSLAVIAKLTETSFNRLPGIGPAAPSLGNACIFILAESNGLSGVAHLSRLKLRIKQNNTQKMIQNHIENKAEKLGLKSTEIEDMAVPDFGLTQGIREWPFKDYKLRLDASEVGQAQISWVKPDGKPQKTVPSFVKESATLNQKLSDIRKSTKEIKKASTAQRDRIDRLYTEDMSWTPEAFHKYYLNHGLLGPMARKLIWQITLKGKARPALYHNNKWETATGKEISGNIESFQLWHPIMSKTKDILAWRERLQSLEIQQPFKQTFREVYLLTDAEVNTKVYSNRMAAHILKQHQFRTLASIRGWKYSLMGAYDDGRDNEVAKKPLPAYGMTAEFWIDVILDEGDSFNDAGIWDYVVTDQIRFSSPHQEHIDLIDIPPIILSEILRDADLFVGVASVGNDPTWADRDGAPRTQQYWQSYSFGDLTETAKTRRSVLEDLLPKLKIRDKAKIDGKFLIVQGSRHSYKIHIGSGNILIQPNDRYLCIVPGRGSNKALDSLYLPFAGDRGLSIVLSKAFMLAEDHKIKDPTILSQL